MMLLDRVHGQECLNGKSLPHIAWDQIVTLCFPFQMTQQNGMQLM